MQLNSKRVSRNTRTIGGLLLAISMSVSITLRLSFPLKLNKLSLIYSQLTLAVYAVKFTFLFLYLAHAIFYLNITTVNAGIMRQLNIFKDRRNIAFWLALIS